MSEYGTLNDRTSRFSPPGSSRWFNGFCTTLPRAGQSDEVVQKPSSPWGKPRGEVLSFLSALMLIACGYLLSTARGAEAPPAGPAKPPAAKPAASLDDQLLKSLSDELLKDLDAAAPKDSRKPASSGGKPPADRPPSDLDRKLLEDGEDAGRGPQDPLIAIGRRMRTAEELIARRETSDPTQRLQKQIVADLAQLVEQLQKQCSSGECSGQKPASKPGAGSQKQGLGKAQGSKTPAKDSVTRIGKPSGDAAALEAKKQLLEEIWGQLPPRLREQLPISAIEQFLPKYERLIEDYYKRLAEERSDK